MRVIAVAIALATALAGCNDLRDYRGDWHGKRVGDAAAVRTGVPIDGEASLSIEAIDTHGLQGTVAVPGVISPTAFASVPGAEADQLAGLTFPGGPIRVYLAFVHVDDAAGDALAMVALYDDDRVQLRVLRGGTRPLYGIFDLSAS